MAFQTKDLIVRTVTNDDIAEVARMWNFGNGSISVAEAENAIAAMQDNHLKNKIGYIYHLCFAVFEKGQDCIIGWCGLDGKSGNALNIFYLIDEHYRNRGYATQCAEGLITYAFKHMHVTAINGGCDKNNKASFRVMKKAGMTQIGFEENGDPLFCIEALTYNKTRK